MFQRNASNLAFTSTVWSVPFLCRLSLCLRCPCLSAWMVPSFLSSAVSLSHFVNEALVSPTLCEWCPCFSYTVWMVPLVLRHCVNGAISSPNGATVWMVPLVLLHCVNGALGSPTLCEWCHWFSSTVWLVPISLSLSFSLQPSRCVNVIYLVFICIGLVSLTIFTAVFFSVHSVHTFQFIPEKDNLVQLNYLCNPATCNYLCFSINISLHHCHPEQ